jgi:hypothetical protein
MVLLLLWLWPPGRGSPNPGPSPDTRHQTPEPLPLLSEAPFIIVTLSRKKNINKEFHPALAFDFLLPVWGTRWAEADFRVWGNLKNLT